MNRSGIDECGLNEGTTSIGHDSRRHRRRCGFDVDLEELTERCILQGQTLCSAAPFE